MKKKKVLLKNELSEVIFVDSKVRVSKNNTEWFFEIGNEMTSDLAEGVSILMRVVDNNHPIWNTEFEVIHENITPEKSLFWLTGGYSEWRTLEHYSKPWCECSLEFQEEFGFVIINSVKRSRNFREVKNNFIKYLNLPILYDFAISKDLIK
jgi:hypothetical protein